MLSPGCGEKGFNRLDLESIKRFNERLGKPATLEAASIALSKSHYSMNRLFRYFCGICWNRIRERDEEKA